jgi:4-amino-4-deoxy-L-arabinose transferase-like glycosyltransferase
MVLSIILLLAAGLRLVNLRQSPPGLNQDEAANAWNAYCLLKTGKDQVGVTWPIFYVRALGGNRSTLYVYLLLPFQAIWGLNVCSTRMPAALCGVLTIALVYFVGERLFDRQTGLFAAGLLALNPWHLQQSRWGHEASLCALLGLAPLAMILWAKILSRNDETHIPKPILAALAGAASGICCYGYQAARVFIPVFLLAATLVTVPAWWDSLKTRKGTLTIAFFIIAFSVVFGPLAWRHIVDPEGMGRHAQFTEFVWTESNSLFQMLRDVVARYIRHFGLYFLFIQGDRFNIQSPPYIGQFHWYMLPLMILGMVTLYRSMRFSYADRVLLVYLLTYPVADCLCAKPSGMHALRSSPGLCSLVLLAAVGAVNIGRWLWKESRTSHVAFAAILAGMVIGLNTRYLYRFYGKYNHLPGIYRAYHSDLVEACHWLRPRFDKFDAIFCTAEGMNMPYIVSLVVLDYDPARWFRESRNFTTLGEWDIYMRYGKMHFDYNGSSNRALRQLRVNGRLDRVALIVRPGQLNLPDEAQVVRVIRRADGEEVLRICVLDL